jgi:hypothetical protein
MTDPIRFTGYDYTIEKRELLRANAIDYDFEQFRCRGDVPDTFGIMDLMIEKKIREDQWRMNSCAGFGAAHAAAVGFWLQTGVWRQFNPHWTYRRGQELDGIRGDNGATIWGVTQAMKAAGLLPEDIENDGKKEFPFPRDQYDFKYPASATTIAKERRIGYTAELKSAAAIFNFLEAGQGAVVIGGPWGNWSPDRSGICSQFRGGGGGHARAYIDRKTLNGRRHAIEINSHFESYGDRGFAYHTESFIDQQCADRNFVAIGVSDLSLSPGDEPKQRRYRRFVKLT